MEIKLPSGNSVHIKDSFSPSDRWAIRDAPDVGNENGQVVIKNAEGNSWKAFYMVAITWWSFPQPIPAVGGPQALDDALRDNLDDLDELEDQCRPVYDRVAGRPNSRRQNRPQQTNGTSTAS